MADHGDPSAHAGKLSSQDYARIKSLFVELCDLPAGERDARLRAVGPPGVRGALEAMLGADGREDALDHVGATGSTPGVRSWSGAGHGPSTGPLPERIGPYRILRLLGEGGMGRVYEAAQDFPRRTVALKVIRHGSIAPSLQRRFQQEVDVLARLRHEGIAQIYEAGKTEIAGQEQPYFAMELVVGLPLTRHAEQHGLDVPGRLELFVKVCDAVHHAHQKGIIHRDLKPGNILVVGDESTTSGRADRMSRTTAATSQPKVLDFGIARITGADARGATIQTDAGQLIGTIPYMSPEQVAGGSHSLDARSDVYALGVILFELLSGRLPHDVRNVSIPEAARIIRDDEPQSLTSVTGAKSSALKGDLGTIVSKALAKELPRRYQTAAELAQDIVRYLDHEPILARPPSTMYHLKKFAQRNRRLAIAMLALLAVLVVAAIGGPLLYLRAESARRLAETRRTTAEDALKEASSRRAEAELARDAAAKSNQTAVREAARAKAISDFVINDVMQAVQPSVENPDVKMIDVLAAAAAKARERFTDEPQVEYSIHDAVGVSYENLGQIDRAMEEAELCLQCARNGGADADDMTIRARTRIGWLLYLKGEAPRAEEQLRAVIADGRRMFPGNDRAIVHAQMGLGEILQSQGKFAEAEPMLRGVLAVQRRLDLQSDKQDDEQFFVLCSLSSLYLAQGRVDEGESVTREIMELARQRPAGAGLATCTAMHQMSTILLKRGRPAEALTLSLEASAIADRATPIGHIARAYPTQNSVIALARLGRFAEAEPLARRAYDAFVAAVGDGRYELENSARWAGQVYEGLCRPVDAAQWNMRYTVLRMRIAGPNEAPSVSSVLFEYEDLVRRYSGDQAAAGAACEIADEIERIAPPSHPSRARALANLARALTADGRYDQAQPLLVEAFAALPSAGTPAEDRPLVMAAIANLYDRLGRSEEAAAWRARAADERKP